MVEKFIAGVVLALCVVVLLGMLIGAKRRERVRVAARRGLHWRSHRMAARREAERAIARARRAVERDGKVHRPKSFNGRPPDEPPKH